MHPTIMMTLATEVANERRNERQSLQLRSQARAAHTQVASGERAANALTRRLLATINLRPRLS